MNRILLPVCLCVMILSACGGQTETPKEISQELFLTDSLQNVVSVDTVYTHEVTDELTLNGRVTFNQEQVARVFPSRTTTYHRPSQLTICTGYVYLRHGIRT